MNKRVLEKTDYKNLLGETVDITIDRPILSCHPLHPDIVYEVNYGFIPNVYAFDNEEADVYLLGVTKPVKYYRAKIIAVINRLNDVENKFVAAPENYKFTKEKNRKAVWFQEKFFKTEIILLNDKKL